MEFCIPSQYGIYQYNYSCHMYQAPPELLQSGRPYPKFLRFLAENGYYGEGDAVVREEF